MTTNEILTDTPAPRGSTAGPSQAVPVSIDALSKWLAVVLVFIYVSGFLTTSLNDFRYGFSELNPLHPRILAAGGWFALFIAVPYALIWELRKSSHWRPRLTEWRDAAFLLYAYWGSTIFIAFFSWKIFLFDETKVVSSQSAPLWKTSIIVLAIVAAVIALFVFASKFAYDKTRKWVVILIFPICAYSVWTAYADIFAKHLFQVDAISLWLIVTGAFIYAEIQQRDWKPRVGSWPGSLVNFLIALAIFATVYYPHIRPQWGGGSPIPIELSSYRWLPFKQASELVAH
jgi:hypothetical protein